MLDMLAMLVPMVLTLMLELMVPTTLARGLLMLSLRLMLLFSMELTDMLDMLLPLTLMDMLHMLDTPMLLVMLVLMVLTTLARGLLMLSLRQRLMLSMVPMDILHI